MATALRTTPRHQPARPAAAARVYAYLRVSTDAQELASQKVGIVDYTQARGLRVDEWVQETASGAVDASKRDLGMKLLPKLQHGDALIIPELSRLGRSTVDVLATLKQLSERKVHVHVVKGAMVLDDSINSKILSTQRSNGTCFASAAWKGRRGQRLRENTSAGPR